MKKISFHISDDNAVDFIFESGTYATASGAAQWVGFVENHELTESQNVIDAFYAGRGSRNVGQFVNGPLDFTGKITYHPNRDWRMLMFALGSNVDGGSPSPYTHTISEADNNNPFTSGTLAPFMSFTLRDSHSSPVANDNFVRTINGCVVNSYKLSVAEGDMVTAEVDYIGQNSTYSSGNVTVATEDTTAPYIWQHGLLHIPSGTTLNATTDFSWMINNNLDAKHFVNGSRVIRLPLPTTRTYECEATVYEQNTTVQPLYDNYFLGGSTFNALFALSASTGSREVFVTMSGCRMVDMTSPTPGEPQPNTHKFKFRPQTCSVLVNDLVFQYNPF